MSVGVESEPVQALNDVVDVQTKVLKEALKNIVELRRALKPFADWAVELDTMPDNSPLVAVFHDTVYNPKAITVAQLRQAKKALYGEVWLTINSEMDTQYTVMVTCNSEMDT